ATAQSGATATAASAVPARSASSPGASPAPGQAPAGTQGVVAKPLADKPAEKPVDKPATAPISPPIRLPNVAHPADKVRPAVAFIAVRSAPLRGAIGPEPRQGVGSGAVFGPRG